MSEQVTANTPMTVGMFNEYMAQRAEAAALAVHRAMQTWAPNNQITKPMSEKRPLV